MRSVSIYDIEIYKMHHFKVHCIIQMAAFVSSSFPWCSYNHKYFMLVWHL